MFDWNDFHIFAKDILASKTDEASMRTAISRTYYSAFHASKDFCEYYAVSHGVKIPLFVLNARKEKDKSIHLRVISALKNSIDPDAQQVGNYLTSLKNRRTHADYDATAFSNS